MAESDPGIDFAEFSAAMQKLAMESERRLRTNGVAHSVNGDSGSSQMLTSLAKMLRPIAIGLESLDRAIDQNGSQLQKLQIVLEKKSDEIPGLQRLEQQLEKKNALETANQKLFDTLYRELKDYKDSFLFESLQKPILRDLMVLYDDIEGVRQQLQSCAQEETGNRGSRLYFNNLHDNVQNILHFLIEVFARMEVTPIEERNEFFSLKTQRIVGHEPAASPAQNNMIARRVKRGFTWRGRMLRLEEVIIKRWKEGPQKLNLNKKSAQEEPPKLNPRRTLLFPWQQLSPTSHNQ